ncbi:hypothetical protein ACFWNG_31180 [Streptomyces sp. NPDC058391]|uniref:hypothetical protein n=1 Tax=Streptomyces sp. NPDC058391 TaxID=3346476 RepID=UPI00365F56C3
MVVIDQFSASFRTGFYFGVARQDQCMSSWGDLASQAASALVGTLAGGAITVHVARWQTTRTIEAQSQLAASQEAANVALARNQWTRQRSAEAAQRLLERLATLYAWLPSLPDVALDEPRLSVQARERCASALESIRHGMQTDLLSIADDRVRARFRILVRLCYDVAWRSIGQQNRERQIRDVSGYLRYVQLSLEAVIDASPMPDGCEPPALERNDSTAWLPPNVPWHWQDPADGS